VVVSAVLVGAMFGAYAAAPVSESKGRRITILVGGVVFVLGAAIMWGAVHIGMLIAGRFVVSSIIYLYFDFLIFGFFDFLIF
jgi:MFS family permease